MRDSEEKVVTRIISLNKAPGAGTTWGKPASVVYAWEVCERLFVFNRWQISSRLRCKVLRLFGAKIGAGVIMRPGVRVTAPGRLSIGDNCWIGDTVWFHNQNNISIGHDVVISQGSFLTNGSHSYKTDMGLITKPIFIESGAWITSRVIVLGGTRIGQSALVGPGSVVSGVLNAGYVYRGNPASVVGLRFGSPDESASEG